MKIAVGSDLHVEWGTFPHLPYGDIDLMIVAGDAGTVKHTNAWLDKQINVEPHLFDTFIIPGNHAGYDGTPWDEIDQVCIRDGVGYSIVGCTLWTDFNLYGDIVSARQHAYRGMNDYRCWYSKDTRLEPIHTEEFHKHHVKFLREHGQGADIIVTHHAPSIRSVNEKYVNDWKYNPCYASNLDWLVEELHPKYWIHGHMHDACEYKIGETTVLCNPRGYPGQNRDWDWRYIEI